MAEYSMAQLLEEISQTSALDWQRLQGLVLKASGTYYDLTFRDLSSREIDWLERAGYDVLHLGNEEYQLEVIHAKLVSTPIGIRQGSKAI